MSINIWVICKWIVSFIMGVLLINDLIEPRDDKIQDRQITASICKYILHHMSFSVSSDLG